MRSVSLARVRTVGSAGPPRKVTAQDVARRAGVSRSAVSLVLNGRADGMISPEKQQAVRDAAKALDYTAHSVAVALRNQRTRTIGVVTDHIATTAYAGQIITGASDVAMSAGYVLFVVDTQGDPDRAEHAYRTLGQRHVDGMVFAAQSLVAYPVSPALEQFPVVLANCFDPHDGLPAVIADEVTGGATAANALIRAGHHDIVLLGGASGWVASGRREEGARRACLAAGLPDPPLVETGWEIRDGYAAATRVLDVDAPPTGLVCANDRVALGATMAALHLGLAVPADVSVVGYDDDENVARTSVPALTTVQLPHREIGVRAMRILLDRIADPETADGSTVLVDCPLIERASVAAPRAVRGGRATRPRG